MTQNIVAGIHTLFKRRDANANHHSNRRKTGTEQNISPTIVFELSKRIIPNIIDDANRLHERIGRSIA